MSLNESGQLSLDFLAGFTIFIIGFIIVITMASGLLVGLQSRTIDYDAVAYRTSVILVEDPGYAKDPQTTNFTSDWEFIPQADKEDILRIGLAISRETPNVLSDKKIRQLFDKAMFSSTDIHTKVLFDPSGSVANPSQFLYRYNITLNSTDPMHKYLNQTGDPVPNNAMTGYMRRFVKIRQPSSSAEFNATSYRYFKIYFDFPTLYGAFPSYLAIDPLKESTSINITPNFNSVSFCYQDTIISELTSPTGPDYTISTGSDYQLLTLDPSFFTRRSIDPGRIDYNLNFTASGSDTRPNITYSSIVTQPPLIPATLEVRVW